eukprot:gene25884-11559_t
MSNKLSREEGAAALKCLKIGDVVLLHVEDREGFVSGSESLLPQCQQYAEQLKYRAELHRISSSFALNGGLPPLGFATDNNTAGNETNISKSTQEKIAMLQYSSERESQSNAEEFVRMVGEPVLYSQVIQLRHVSSGKFVTINKSAALVERGALQVMLCDGDTGSLFHIQSGYKTKIDGSRVLLGEAVTFMSAGLDGMGLHISVVPVTDPSMLPINLHVYVRHTWELSASQNLSPVKLTPFAVHPRMNPAMHTALLGYSFVSIEDLRAHMKYYDVLTSDDRLGAFFESPISRPAALHGKVQGTDLWRLEPQQIEFCGMPMTLESKVRLFHVVTGKYLAGRYNPMSTDLGADNTCETFMTEEYNSPMCTWRLVSFTQHDEENRLGHEVFAFFKHDSGRWLVSGSKAKVADAIESEEAEQGAGEVGMMSYKVASLDAVRLDRNVMMIRAINDTFVNKVNRVCAVRMVLSHFVRKIGQLQLPSEQLIMDNSSQPGPEPSTWTQKLLGEAGLKAVFDMGYDKVRMTLNELICLLEPKQWLDSDEPDGGKTYQTLILSVGLIKIVVDLLTVCPMRFFFWRESAHGTQLSKLVIECGQLCHQLLVMLCKNNETVQGRIAEQHLAAIKNHLGGPVKAADTLAAVYSDNLALVQTITNDTLQSAVDLIRKYGHRPHFLNFLVNMCGTAERPVPKNQNWLLMQLSERPTDVWFPTTLYNGSAITSNNISGNRATGKNSGTLLVSVPAPNGNSVQLDCSIFKQCLDDSTTSSIREWDYSQVLMQASDRHKTTSGSKKDETKKEKNQPDRWPAISFGLGLEFPTLQQAVSNENLPFALRRAMTNVLVSLYVDVNPYQMLHLPRQTRLLTAASSSGAGNDRGKTDDSSCSEHDANISLLLDSTILLLSVQHKQPGFHSTASMVLNSHKVRSRTRGRLDSIVHNQVSPEDLPLDGSGKFSEDGEAGKELHWPPLIRIDEGTLDPSSWDRSMVKRGWGGREGIALAALDSDRRRTQQSGGSPSLKASTQSSSSMVAGMVWNSPLAPEVLGNSRRAEAVLRGTMTTGGNSFISEVLKCKGTMTTGGNSFISEVLKALLMMFQLGMMPLSSAKTLPVLKLVMELLISKLGLSEEATGMNCGYSTLVVMEAKTTMLRILDFAMDMHNEDRCTSVFAAFQRGHAYEMSEPRNSSVAGRESKQSPAARGSRGSALSLAGRGSKDSCAQGGHWITGSPVTWGVGTKVEPGSPGRRSVPGLPAAWGGSSKVVPDLVAPDLQTTRDVAMAAIRAMREGNSSELKNSLFSFDPAGSGFDSSVMSRSFLSQWLDLSRYYASNEDVGEYENPGLIAKLFEMIDRLLSQRKKLVISLRNTFVIEDTVLILVHRRTEKLIQSLLQHYQYVGSPNADELQSNCKCAAQSFAELSSFLKPDTNVTIHQGGSNEEIRITKVSASNMQFVMSDLRAHLVALKYLQLILRRKPAAKGQMPEAQDPHRREVFSQAYEFLRHFMVVGELGPQGIVNTANQAVLLPHLPLLLSQLGVQKLIVADTISALFLKNKDAASTSGSIVLHKILELLVQYGERRRFQWLDFLESVVIVNGEPIKENQNMVLQLIAEDEDKLLQLFNTTDGAAARRELMLANEHLTGMNDAATSGYVSLKDVLDTLLMAREGLSPATLRYVHKSYWSLLHQAYFATDTENTRRQVQDPNNRIWPLVDTQAGETQDGTGRDESLPFDPMSRFLSDLPSADRARSSGTRGPPKLFIEPSGSIRENPSLTGMDSLALGTACGILRASSGGGGGGGPIAESTEARKEYLDELEAELSNLQLLNASNLQLLKASNPQLMNTSNPQLLNASNPQLMNASNPQLLNASNPQLLNASNPQLLNASNPQLMNASNPQLLNASNPQLLNASNPQLLNASNPQLLNTANLELLSADNLENLINEMSTEPEEEIRYEEEDQELGSCQSLTLSGFQSRSSLTTPSGEGIGMATHTNMPLGKHRHTLAPAPAHTGMPTGTQATPHTLIEAVVLDIQSALRDPQAALSNHDSASYFLVDTVFPAMHFKSLSSSSVVATIKSERKMAMKWSRRLLSSLAAVCPDAADDTAMAELAGTDAASSTHKTSKSALKAIQVSEDWQQLVVLVAVSGDWQQLVVPIAVSEDWQQLNVSIVEGLDMYIDPRNVSEDWQQLIVAIAEGLDMYINPSNNEPIEMRVFDQGNLLSTQTVQVGTLPPLILHRGTMFVMARLIAQPHGTLIHGSDLTFEVAIKALCRLPYSTSNLATWPEVLTVRLLRALRCAHAIDDGRASETGWRTGWTELDWLDAPSHGVATPDIIKEWRQRKYNVLGATEMAFRLLAHPNKYIAFEATDMLLELLNGRNRAVQETLLELLRPGHAWTYDVLCNITAVLRACAAMLPLQNTPSRGSRKHPELSTGKASGPDGSNDTEGEEADESGDQAEGEEEEEDEEVLFVMSSVQLNDADDTFLFAGKLLNCMQSMGNGQFRPIKKLLQSQPQPVDMLLEAVNLLNVLQNHVQDSFSSGDDSVPNLMVDVLEFLTEMVQGPCPSNQLVLASVQTNLLAICNRIFGYIEYVFHRLLIKPRVASMKCKIKRATLNLLISMLEGLSNDEVAQRCSDVLDWTAVEKQPRVASLRCKIKRATLNLLISTLEGLSNDEVTQRCSDVLDWTAVEKQLSEELLLYVCFVLKLNIYSEMGGREPVLPFLQVLGDHRQHAQRIRAFMIKHIGYVEIVFQETLEPVFFLLSSKCQELAGSVVWKNTMLDKIQSSISPECRSLPQSGELIVLLDDAVRDITIESKSSMKWVSVLLKYKLRLQTGSFYLALAALLLLVFVLDEDHRESFDAGYISAVFGGDSGGPAIAYIIVYVINLTQCCCTALVFVAYCFSDFSKYIKTQQVWLAQAAAEQARMDAMNAMMAALPGSTSATKSDKELDHGPASNSLFQNLKSVIIGQGTSNAGRDSRSIAPAAASSCGVLPPPIVRPEQSNFVKLMVASAQLVFFWRFWFMLILFTASILALITSPFWLCILFFIYFVDFSSGATLMQAMNRAGTNIIATFVMGVLTIFIFSIITYSLFRDEGVEGELPPCNTFYQYEPKKQARSAMVLIFYMLWQFVLLSIFVGLIASAFEAIRDDQRTVHEDSTSKCLVCSRDMYDFAHNTRKGFKHHLERHHSPINYIFYMHYLKQKDPDELNGSDSAVFRLLQDSETSEDRASWLPVNRSLTLQWQDQEVEQDQKQTLLLERISQRLEEMEEEQRGMATILRNHVADGRPRRATLQGSRAKYEGGGDGGEMEGKEDFARKHGLVNEVSHWNAGVCEEQGTSGHERARASSDGKSEIDRR